MSYKNKFVNDIKFNIESADEADIYSKLCYQIKRDKITKRNEEVILYMIQGLYDRFDMSWEKYTLMIERNNNFEEERKRQECVEIIKCIRKLLKRFKMRLGDMSLYLVEANDYAGYMDITDDEETISCLKEQMTDTYNNMWIIMNEDNTFSEHEKNVFQMLNKL